MMSYNLSGWDKVWVSVKSQGIDMLGRIAEIEKLDDNSAAPLKKEYF